MKTDCTIEQKNVKITGCTVEYMKQPIGLETRRPRFGWNIETDIRGWKQYAYQIAVYSDELKWDSGKVLSSRMADIIYEGAPLCEQTLYTWTVTVWDDRERIAYISENNSFETGIKETSWIAKWIGAEKNSAGIMPVFRKEFNIAKELKDARVYISGAGHYELRLNGGKASEDVLEPAWTNYNKSIFYSIYHVKEKLHRGNNAFGVLLGNGMYHVEESGRYTKFTGSFGETGFILELHIDYTDGTSEVILSDTSWHTASGPITFSHVYGGEDYNALNSCEGFDTAGFKMDKGWQPVCLITPPRGKLMHRKNPPLKIKETIAAKVIAKPRDTVYIYDTGKNISGWFCIEISGKPGQQVKITPYEMFDKNGELSQAFTGAPHYYSYTLGRGRINVWEPRFTYYGFRYIKVEGAVPIGETAGGDSAVIHSLSGKMIYPDIKPAGEFRCSDFLLNKTHEIITQAMLCNMKSVFTDCPHREKLGWLEQTHLIGPAIMYNYDVHHLFLKVLNDIREGQEEDGLVPDIVPEYINFARLGMHTGFRDSPEWGSAAIIVPWYLYKNYGDVRVLKENYDVMKKYLDYLTGKTQYHILHHGLGDWCDFGVNPPFSQNTPIPVTATAIYYYDITIMEKVAELLGKTEDVTELEILGREVKEAFNREFFDDQGIRYSTGSQTANAMAIFMGLTDGQSEHLVLDYLVNDIKIRGNHTTGGDVGHPFILRTLEKFGRSGLIADMLAQTDAPSYGYQILHGATTLCEEWNGNDPDNPSSSQNHFMLGSGEEWLYSGLAGLKSVHEAGEENSIRIEPCFPERLTGLRAWHRYTYGIAAIQWERTLTGIDLKLKLPAGSTGRLTLPRGDRNGILESGHPVSEMEGLLELKQAGDKIELVLVSGEYSFSNI